MAKEKKSAAAEKNQTKVTIPVDRRRPAQKIDGFIEAREAIKRYINNINDLSEVTCPDWLDGMLPFRCSSQTAGDVELMWRERQRRKNKPRLCRQVQLIDKAHAKCAEVLTKASDDAKNRLANALFTNRIEAFVLLSSGEKTAVPQDSPGIWFKQKHRIFEASTMSTPWRGRKLSTVYLREIDVFDFIMSELVLRCQTALENSGKKQDGIYAQRAVDILMDTCITRSKNEKIRLVQSDWSKIMEDYFGYRITNTKNDLKELYESRMEVSYPSYHIATGRDAKEKVVADRLVSEIIASSPFKKTQ